MPWLNLAVLVLSTLLTLASYVLSAGPAALERRIGPASYARCALYRLAASIWMVVAAISYALYLVYPLPIRLPCAFPWPWWLSALVAGLIVVPAGTLWVWGMLDAGRETIVPRKDQPLFGGIYRRVRHPQALGELLCWWVIAFVLHSPFLALYSFVWVPVFVLMCLAEERDLLLRFGQDYAEYRRRTGFFLPKRRVS